MFQIINFQYRYVIFISPIQVILEEVCPCRLFLYKYSLFTIYCKLFVSCRPIEGCIQVRGQPWPITGHITRPSWGYPIAVNQCIELPKESISVSIALFIMAGNGIKFVNRVTRRASKNWLFSPSDLFVLLWGTIQNLYCFRGLPI